MKNFKYAIILMLALLVLFACTQATEKKNSLLRDDQGLVILSDAQIENLVKRSYQYVALYNVNNKTALKQGGYNTLQADTKLKDHSMKDIARPNNDSFYSMALFDLTGEPMVLYMPSFNSDYVSLMVTAYDHYVDVPKASRNGDFKTPEHILFYSDRTQGYNGQEVAGVDEVYKTTGDYISAILRIMPHAADPERFKDIVEEIGQIKILTLSEFSGSEAIAVESVSFPDVGQTDLDVFENNLLEVMQFVFNHISFDPEYELDQKLLEAYKPLGIIPGKEYNPEEVKIDGKKFREVAEKIQREYLGKLTDPDLTKVMSPKMFKTKGLTDLETLVTVSIIGPIGLPMEEAMYPNITAESGEAMNAMNDYVVKMQKEELPPDQAFWSLTLYDKANGFFIPNDRKKYSVGENAGFKLNEQGGIEIYIAAEKPLGVPEENWLPLNRKDEVIDLILRVYVPDLEKMKTWTAPKAKKLEN